MTCSEPSIPIAGGRIPLHALLDERAAAQPDRLTYRFLTDGEDAEQTLTIGALADRSRRIARALVELGARGRPVLLLEPPGCGFVEGLFACWHAGAIAVPAYPPRGTRHRQRLEAIRRDSGATLALAAAGTPGIPGIELMETAVLVDGGSLEGPPLVTDGPCLLQYTSGSTAAPKGVRISHDNLRAHHAALAIYRSLDLRSAVSWLPPYHDMGLVLKILHAFEAGIPLTWFSPEHFIQRPVRWLRAISRFRGELSGAPDFAFAACLRGIRDEDMTDIDLSCWKAAPCGAERVRAGTLERFARRFGRWGFREEAFLPGYGLAETTLIVTACRPGGKPRVVEHPEAGRLVSCGPPLDQVRLTITDAATGSPVPEGRIGEIRVTAPVVAHGYWNRPEETAEVFGDPETGIRTGDLGFIDNGELFVTGRSKDLIIIEGVNHAPEDIEEAALEASHDVLAAAAFSMELPDGREGAALAVEVAATPGLDHAALCSAVRRAVGQRSGIALQRIVVVRHGLIPRTTSGKIRRAACREALAAGSLRHLFDDMESATPPPAEAGDRLSDVLAAVAGIAGHQAATAADSLIGLGLGSLDAARLAAALGERTGIRVPVGEVLASRSFAELAARLDGFPRCDATPVAACEPGTLTHSQERMWLLHQLDPSSAAYHVFGVVELNGPVNREWLQQAFSAAVPARSMLRSRHAVRDDGELRAWIESAAAPPLVITPCASDEQAQAELKRFATAPFHLESEPPARATIIPLGSHRHLLAICAHHIAADGWSMRILAERMARAYTALHEGGTVVSEPETTDFLEFAAHHRAWCDSGAVDPQVDYWKRRLAGHPGIIPLPVDFPRPARPSSDGGSCARILPAELCNRVAELARLNQATPFMVHLAAFLILLRQHGAGDDLIAAVPVANRHLPGSASCVGTLVNTLPFRMHLDPQEPFTAWLERVRAASLEMQENQDAPFERIIEAVAPDRSGDHPPLAQVMFDHQEIPIADHWPGGLVCKPYDCHRGASQFDLSLLLNVFPDHQQACIEYRSDLFRETSVSAMMDRYLVILANLCEQPDAATAELACLSAEDRDWLRAHCQGPSRPEFPQTPTPQLIAKRAAAHPSRVAIRDAHGEMDYATLASESDRIAAALRGLGVAAGDRVAVLLERDRMLPATLLGIWKCGAAYVPLDRSNPPARLALILADQQPLTILVSRTLRDRLPEDTPAIVHDELIAMASGPAPRVVITPETPAYVIHTSGSTGAPKGVVVSHGALANFLRSMAETPGFTEADHLLAVTTVSFDISALELFLPLVCGGSLTLAPTLEAGDGPALRRRLESSGATVMQATPATWRILLDAGWQGSGGLKILCGGEAMELQLAHTLATAGCQLWNLYGPTETTVWSTCWRVPPAAAAIRIGRPIANTGVHILAPDLSPLPPGVPGELWISGAGLADGYWNQPGLTAERFRNVIDHTGRPVRAYRTGDLARWHADGTLECLGRTDNQIKIRGFRVELGEIEAALAAHPAVAAARVALRGPSPENRRLVAWFTPRAGSAPPPVADLRAFLAGRLPPHMLPADIGAIDAFPLGASGKVDTSQLPDPQQGRPPADATLSATEERIIAIWRELLERTDVHPDDDWFHIGGHSLPALRMFARIRQVFGTSLPLSVILDHNTPRKLAALIDHRTAAGATP